MLRRKLLLILPALLAAAALVLFFTGWLSGLAAGVAAVALVSAVASPPVLGRVGDVERAAGASARHVDPAQVKAYRKAHPGATIMEAVRAIDDR